MMTFKMDEAGIKFLTEHKLSHLIDNFEKEELTSRDFKFLTKHPTELVLVAPRMRDRIDFMNAVEGLMIDKAVMADLDPVYNTSTTLFEILKLYPKGQQFMELYDKYGQSALNQDTRKLVKYAMVEHFIVKGHGIISIPMFHEMVQMVLDQFPQEDATTWYAPAIDDCKTDGMFYNWYWYVRRHDPRFKNQHDETKKSKKKDGDTAKNTKQTSSKHAEDLSERDSVWESLTQEEQNVCTASKIKLKGLSMTSTAEVSVSWNECYNLRRYEAIHGKLLLDDWVVFRHYGDIQTLVSYDFDKIHGPKSDNLYRKIPLFVQKFKSLIDGFKQVLHTNKDLYDAVLQTFTSDSVIDEKSIFLAMYCLPRILRQHFIKKGNKKLKLSDIETQNAFLVLVPTDATVNEMILQRRSIASSQKSTVQPFIVAVGSLAELNNRYFVILDDIMLNCKTVSSAVDLLFKLHSVLHLEYAAECGNVMFFLQKFFYEISYPKEKRNPEVLALISDLLKTM